VKEEDKIDPYKLNLLNIIEKDKYWENVKKVFETKFES
jgi:hypothetical protein